MGQNIQSRIRRGLTGQGYSQAATIIIQLLTIPIFLAFWDIDLYGEWLLLSAIPSYLLMSDLGFGGTAAREMAMMVAANERAKALIVFQSIWFLISLISLVIVIVTIGFNFANLLPINEWFNFSIIDSVTTKNVLTVMILQVLIHLQGQMIYAGFNSEGSYGLGTIWLTSIRLGEFLAQITAIFLGAGPLAVVLSSLAARTLCTFFMRIGLSKVAPWISYGTKNVSLKEIKRLTKPALSALAFPLGHALNIQGARIIVGAALGPAMVVTFTAMRTLTRFLTMALAAINRITQPEISIAYGKGDKDLLRQLYRKTCQLALWGSFILSLAMYFFGEPILDKWTDGALVMNLDLFLIMLVASSSQSIWIAMMVVLFATNRHNKVAVYFIIANIVFLALANYLLANYSVIEMMMSLAACELLMLFFILPSSLQITNDNLGSFFSDILRPPFFIISFFSKKNLLGKL